MAYYQVFEIRNGQRVLVEITADRFSLVEKLREIRDVPWDIEVEVHYVSLSDDGVEIDRSIL